MTLPRADLRSGGVTTAQSLPVLQAEIASCTICPSLKPWRRFDPDAYGTSCTGYLLVGEAPGHVSWRTRRRFAGPAGLLIRRALRQAGHPRYQDLEDLFYMTDVVKCHPAPMSNPASNRSPRPVEVRACSDFLVRELRVLGPSVVVAFGKLAADRVGRAIEEARLPRRPELLAFPHPSPRNQVAIRKRYPSMQAFERAIARSFRRLIERLEQVESLPRSVSHPSPADGRSSAVPGGVRRNA